MKKLLLFAFLISSLAFPESSIVINAGSSLPWNATGDLVYYGASGPTRLGIGGTGQVLEVVTGVPAWATISGTGTVTGPISSTDRAIATWNSTTGTALRDNSLATIDGSGNLTAVGINATGSFNSSALTASQAVFTDGSKNLVSNTVTGNGAVVMSNQATLNNLTTLNTVTMNSATVSGSLKKGNCHIEPTESDLGNSGSALTIDLSTATLFTVTLNSATPVITFTNPQASCAYAFRFQQDTGGSRVPSYSGVTAKWGNSGSKTLSTGASAIDKFVCVYDAGLTALLCDLGTTYQ